MPHYIWANFIKEDSLKQFTQHFAMPDVSVHLISIFSLKQACLQYELTTPLFDACLLISCGNIIDGVRGINRLPCVPVLSLSTLDGTHTKPLKNCLMHIANIEISSADWNHCNFFENKNGFNKIKVHCLDLPKSEVCKIFYCLFISIYFCCLFSLFDWCVIN